MKKLLLSIALVIALCLALASCSSTSSQSESTPHSEATSVSALETDTSESDTDTNTKETEQSSNLTSMEGEGDVGSYHVVINGAKKGTDYEGNPVIIISYTWTNNSDETTSPLGSTMPQAFQDGVSMDTGILDHEYNDGMKEVRPGTSIDVDAVFSMTSDSVVEFEISAIEDTFKSPVPTVTMNFDPSSID